MEIITDKSGDWYGTDVYLKPKEQKLNATAIIHYLKLQSNHNWSDRSICAMLGNMAFESTLNPQLNERGGGSGYGLVQWTPKSKLIANAKSIGRKGSYDTMFTQLSVIDYECDTGKQWAQTSEYPISFKEFIEDTTHSVLWLTGAWLKNYERPRDQSQSAIQTRYNGDSGHIGSSEWIAIVGGDTGQSAVDGFLKWLKMIADNNEYVYVFGANHGTAPFNWDSYLTVKAFDCSSYVSFGLYHGGGYNLDAPFDTSTQAHDLKKLGFDVISFKNKNQLKRGDILICDGHTEVVYSVEGDDIKLIGAHNNSLPVPDQISVRNYYNDSGRPWTDICRPFDTGGGQEYTTKRVKNKYLVFNYGRFRK